MSTDERLIAALRRVAVQLRDTGDHDDTWESTQYKGEEYDVNLFFRDNAYHAVGYPCKRTEQGYLTTDTSQPIPIGKLD